MAPKALKAAIAAAWKVPVLDHYGQTEMGLAGAVECPRAAGPHLRDADLIAEIIGPNGEVLADGHVGELLLTSLAREAMPLIRYRTGDLAKLEPGGCPCGSVMTRMTLLGRAADVFSANGKVLSLAALGEILYALPELAGFAASLEPGPILNVAVIPIEEAKPSRDAAASAVAAALAKFFGGSSGFKVTEAEPGLVPAAGGLKPVLRRQPSSSLD